MHAFLQIHVSIFSDVPNIVHQQHRAVGHHGKVGSVQVRQNPNIPNTDLLLGGIIEHWEEKRGWVFLSLDSCLNRNSEVFKDYDPRSCMDIPLTTARCFPETVICLKWTVGGGKTVRVVLTVEVRRDINIKSTYQG